MQRQRSSSTVQIHQQAFDDPLVVFGLALLMATSWHVRKEGSKLGILMSAVMFATIWKPFCDKMKKHPLWSFLQLMDGCRLTPLNKLPTLPTSEDNKLKLPSLPDMFKHGDHAMITFHSLIQSLPPSTWRTMIVTVFEKLFTGYGLN